jgi:hypothetical protein
MGDAGGITACGVVAAAVLEGLPHFGQNRAPASITEPQELQNAIVHLNEKSWKKYDGGVYRKMACSYPLKTNTNLR